jgi:hypothetical protein
MNLLTTYTHNSEWQTLTVLPLITANSQITTAPAKPFPVSCVFTSRSLATAFNSGDSSASCAQVVFTAPRAELPNNSSHIATDGQWVSLGVEPQASYGLVFCGAPSLTRGRVCLLYMLLALANAVFLGSESIETRDHILLSQIWYFLFIDSYDLQGHGGGIQPLSTDFVPCLEHLVTDHVETPCFQE